uniref:Non-specific serine/threonine protein kinase n=1 Tax=Physcomitrium patens TaxID=3218 RepID=A0A7I4F837_PHYPA
MIPIANFEQHARRFLEQDLSMQNRLTLATEVRDSIEIVHTSEYLNFLKSYFVVFSNLLTKITKPQATDNVEHKLRNVVIEILNRLPHSEVLRLFVQDLLKLSMHVLACDNEENGLICLRIIFDLHKNFRPALEPDVQQFLDFVREIYQNFRATVTYFFEESSAPDVQLAAAHHNLGYMGQMRSPAGGPMSGQLNQSTRSFKVVTECPLIVMFLFQLYPRYVPTNIPLLLPLMVSAIGIPGPTEVPPTLKNVYAELKGAQVKTVSFLTYLLRSFADCIRPHEDSISKSIVSLLVSCPDSVSIRKELLVATRHVLATDFRRGFFPQIDTLLDERVLVGTGRACYETLRPLAYSLLAELIHHVRLDLSLPQLSRIVYLFSRNVHDSSLPLSVQTTCVRLMLNLVETIFGRRVDHLSREEGRALLGRILDAFVSKFGTLKHSIPQLLEEDGEDRKERRTLRSRLELPVQAALNLQVPPEHSKEVMDCKQLLKTLIMGMKTLVWSITHFNATPLPQMNNAPVPVKGMREEEVRLASGILKSGLHCLALFKEKDEEKEMYTHYSSVFAVMEHRNLMDMFSLCMPQLFDCMLANLQLLQIFSTLLYTPKVTKHFADVLVNYLVTSKLDTLKQPDTPAAKLVLQLFRYLFVAVAKFSADCERVLQPHVITLMESCMKNATEVEKPLGYMQLLRTMFRALSGGKFELLFREFIPTLQPCLNMLLAMVEGPTGLDMIDLVVELCLTLPARLSSLLPHLHRLMKPLVLALGGSDELVALGLRTLEFWIDSLNPEFLEPSMATVMSDLILTLWSHLRPKPYLWGGKALQLLGKLGGRNRRFLKEPLSLECKENPEHGLRLILTFEPTTSFLVPLDRCIYLARAAVMGTQVGVDSFYRKHALKFLRVCLASVLNLKGNVGGEGVTPGQLSTMFITSVDPSRRRAENPNVKGDLGVKTKTQLMAERSVFKVLLMTVIAASMELELQDGKDDFAANICRHFAMIFHVESAANNPGGNSGPHTVTASGVPNARTRSNRAQANLKELDPLIFLDALVAVLADENRAHAKAALNGLNIFAETLLLLARSKHTGILTPRGVSTPGTPMSVSSPSMNPVYSPPPGVRVPVFEQLLPRLLHCCYGSTWQAQMGGVIGLGALVGKATVEMLCQFQVRAVRALIYVLKRLPPHANAEQEEASQVLNQVLRVVNNVEENNSEPRRQSFLGVVEVLAGELFNSNASYIVRKNVQSCLALLASRTGSEVSELLEPHYQPLLTPLVYKPLRSKHAEQQVGTVMALNFCLALRPPLLKMRQELSNILQESLQIAEADESVLNGKFMNPKMAATLTKLRTVCIELLCTAMAWADFKTQSHAELRSRIIAMFFKSLTCRTPEIVAVAKEGLRQVIQQQKMPKELLQSSLRPILVNLAHYKNLTMPLLQGLARLLELLSNWFNVTLGEKLMEHLKKWLEPEKLSSSQKSWKAGEEPKIAGAIIELFHLLPPAAQKFLDQLVTLTMQLEAALPPSQVYSELNSPYRLPLTKFLNRYAPEAVDYFLGRLTQPTVFRRFMDIIQSEGGQPLREELARSPNKIIQSAFPAVEENAAALIPAGGAEAGVGPAEAGVQATAEAQFQGVALVSALVKLLPDWLHQNRAVFDALVRLWQSPARQARLINEQGLSLNQVKESKRLVKCFLNYLRHDKAEVNVLFEMLSIFLVRTRIDYTFLKEFYMVEVGEGYSPQEKKAVLLCFLELFQTKRLPQDVLVVAMQMLILPMLTHSFQQNQCWDVVDATIIKTIIEKLLDPPEEVSADYDESLRIELLQLATLLLKHLPSDLVHHRKELIKFGWNHLKREESASKQWAFVNVCQFLEAYQAPEKIILQVFVALLRTCQPEHRVLVKQALDILMPALPRRLPLGENKIPIWIRYTKKILVEEGHSVPNLIHIFQLLVRHANLFYNCRAQFVPQMVNSLSRLGLPQNTPLENRRLAIDLAGLVVMWEKRRQAEAKGSSTEGDGQSKSAGAEGQVPAEAIAAGGAPSGTKRTAEAAGLTGVGDEADEEFKPNAAMEEMIINFLIRVALVTEPKDKETQAMYKQALELLTQALEVWPHANVKFNYLEKILSAQQPAGQSKDPATALAQGLDVMNKAVEKQPHLFIRNNVHHIIQVLEPSFNCKLPEIGNSLCTLLKMVFEAFPVDASDTHQDVKLLHQKVEELIQKQLTTVTSNPTQPPVEASVINVMISFTLNVLKTLVAGNKQYVDKFMLYLVRVFHRLAREMATTSAQLARQGHRPEADATNQTGRGSADLSLSVNNLKTLMKLISERVLLLPESKRLFCQMLPTVLGEKGTDTGVLLAILELVRDWVEHDFKGSNQVASTAPLVIKDVVAFMQRLAQVDCSGMTPAVLEEWDRMYLKLLHRLCSDTTKYNLSVRQEVFQKVERQFMLGLRSRDPEMRQKFFTLYHDSISKTLFTRLQYIIQTQEWEALSDVFWLKQCLDLLLAILVEHEPITLAPNSAQVPPLMASGVVPERAGMQLQACDPPDESDGATPTFMGIVNKHARFLNEVSKLQVADLVMPLRELAHTDAHVAYHMWVLVFPIVWATLQKEEQVMLAKPMITLLSKEYHSKQLDKRPNVVQALLEGLSLSQPQPKIPSELIKFLGKTYNAWHIAISLLESHVMLFPQETRCFDALAELYRMLNEEDVRYGLWKRRTITADTRAGLSLLQHGLWQRAQDVFYNAMNKATQGSYNAGVVSKAEMCLWEEQWVACAKRLSQWDILVDFGRSVENYDILLDTLIKVPDWTLLKETVLPKAQVDESPKFRMVQAYVALNDGSLASVTEADGRVGQGVELALHQWWQLPEMAVQSHIPLLQQFQQLVELQESARVLLEIGNGNKPQPQGSGQVAGIQGPAGAYVDLKDILETWRLRTPNEWDELTVWMDLLQWRNHMYNTVINAFKGFSETNPQLHQLGFRDKAWSVNKLAYVARRQGLYEVCVSVLNKMYGFLTMEVQEAFVKIREQAKAYLEMKGELASGLSLINTTNLEYFPLQHKAEIFRLKGDFLQKMNDMENANQAYCTAISLYKHLPKGWISWGNHCDQVYKETNEDLWLEYAVSCFLQGIKYGSKHGRNHLARVLFLLSFDNQTGSVSKAFDKYCDSIPQWVWLAWIPQLLLSLQRPEAASCKNVILKLAAVFPQALYYWLRTYLLERRDIANKPDMMRGTSNRTLAQVSSTNVSNFANSSDVAASPATNSNDTSSSIQMPLSNSGTQGNQGGSASLQSGTESSTITGQETERGSSVGEPSGSNISGTSMPGEHQTLRRLNSATWPNSPTGPSPAVGAFEAAKDIMEALRTKHTNLANELEVMLTEIGARFVPLPEERLLAVVHALLHRCYKYPTATTAEVPQSLKKELAGVCRACFSVDTINKHVDFVTEYKREFERDLDPDSASTFPATLAELTEKLKTWKGVLQSNVEDRLPAVLKLEEESRSLREFHVLDIEVPGQYFNDQEVAPDHTVKLDRIGADVPIVRRHGSSHRRLTLVGNDGSQKHFLVQTSLTPSARSDERMVQLFRVLNRLLDKHKESRRRHLAFNTPIIIPVWPQVRLVEDDLMYSTFGEVYEINCARYGREADLPITHFKERLNQAITGQLNLEALVDLRLHTYNEITNRFVSENVFSQFMYKTLPTCNHLWTFKKQFAVQLALSGFMSYMLQIGGRSPNKILFAKNTGKVFQNDFHPAYDIHGMVEFAEPVPFRLTRNLQTFFTPFGVEGLFISSMCAAAQAVVAPKNQHVKHQLAMFFRDELISWSWRRPPGPSPANGTAGGMSSAELKTKVAENVEQVITRVQKIAPQCFPEEEENSTEPPQSVQRGVSDLVDAALRPKSLCMMDPTWHPWF